MQKVTERKEKKKEDGESRERKRASERERDRVRKCARSRALPCDVIIACATVIDVRGGIDDEENDVGGDYRG